MMMLILLNRRLNAVCINLYESEGENMSGDNDEAKGLQAEEGLSTKGEVMASRFTLTDE
jgi:hypothetical protein